MKRAQMWGATNLRIEYGGKHPKLVGDFEGATFKYVVPATSGDRRSELNCLCGLRRMLGVTRNEQQKLRQAPRRRRRLRPHDATPKFKPVSAPKTQREDKFYTPLARLMETFSGEERANISHMTYNPDEC
ncbi:hypothetical protein [Hyphomonas adhaerens]|nr:hypothetical protein [Hyphomonas adhaerens]